MAEPNSVSEYRKPKLTLTIDNNNPLKNIGDEVVSEDYLYTNGRRHFVITLRGDRIVNMRPIVEDPYFSEALPTVELRIVRS